MGPGFEVSEVLTPLLSLIPCCYPEGWGCFPTDMRLRESSVLPKGTQLALEILAPCSFHGPSLLQPLGSYPGS